MQPQAMNTSDVLLIFMANFHALWSVIRTYIHICMSNSVVAVASRYVQNRLIRSLKINEDTDKDTIQLHAYVVS